MWLDQNCKMKKLIQEVHEKRVVGLKLVIVNCRPFLVRLKLRLGFEKYIIQWITLIQKTIVSRRQKEKYRTNCVLFTCSMWIFFFLANLSVYCHDNWSYFTLEHTFCTIRRSFLHWQKRSTFNLWKGTHFTNQKDLDLVQ